MREFISLIRDNRYVITVMLSLLAIGVEFFYTICATSCVNLRGDLFGVELQYIGIGYMILIIIFAILKKDVYLIFLLSSGVGSEFYLIGYQIWYETYCPYCLVFGGILILQFLIDSDWNRKRIIFISMVIGLLIFSLFFKGSTTVRYDSSVKWHIHKGV